MLDSHEALHKELSDRYELERRGRDAETVRGAVNRLRWSMLLAGFVL